MDEIIDRISESPPLSPASSSSIALLPPDEFDCVQEFQAGASYPPPMCNYEVDATRVGGIDYHDSNMSNDNILISSLLQNLSSSSHRFEQRHDDIDNKYTNNNNHRQDEETRNEEAFVMEEALMKIAHSCTGCFNEEYETNRMLLYNSHGHDAIVNAMNDWIQYPIIQYSACRALTCILCSMPLHIKNDILINTKIFDVTIDAIRIHCNNAFVCMSGCHLLANIVYVNVSLSIRGIDSVLRSMQQYTQQLEMQRIGCLYFYNISNYCNKINNYNCLIAMIESIINAMKSFPKSRSLQYCSSYTIWNIRRQLMMMLSSSSSMSSSTSYNNRNCDADDHNTNSNDTTSDKNDTKNNIQNVLTLIETHAMNIIYNVAMKEFPNDRRIQQIGQTLFTPNQN